MAEKTARKATMTVARLRKQAAAWSVEHNGITCVAIAVATAAALVALFLFVAFSDYGASADFIYNQF